MQAPSSDMSPAAPPPVVLTYTDVEPLKSLAKILKDAPAGTTPTAEVVISPELMSPGNKQVRSRHLWGDQVYTDDSDLVSVLIHMGFFSPTLPSPPHSVREFRARIKLSPPQNFYPSNSFNTVRSRSWHSSIAGCSYTVEKLWLVTRDGTNVALERLREHPAGVATYVPSTTDRQVNTRSGMGMAKARLVQEMTLQYNLCNEPWLKYNIIQVCDRGLKPSQRTSARIIDEALYLETVSERYEVSHVGTMEEDNESKEVYRWARCRKLLGQTAMRGRGTPLPPGDVEVIHDSLQWEELQWGVSSLRVRGTVYKVLRLHFMPVAKVNGGAAGNSSQQ